MKNQYFGDINDYRKYGLLRGIRSATGLRLTVAWMLTPDDGSTDGGEISYLSEPQRWERFDPPLFGALRAVLSSRVPRRVAEIESTDLLPGAHYFSKLVLDGRESRSLWFEELLAFAAGSDLVFLDPDTGLEVPSTPLGRKDSSKYLYWHEVEALWRARHSLLIYQHFPREERAAFVARIADELQRRTGATLVEAIRTPKMVFFLATQEAHRTRLISAIESLEHTWAGQLHDCGLRDRSDVFERERPEFQGSAAGGSAAGRRPRPKPAPRLGVTSDLREFNCPIPGCTKVFLRSRGGWDGHVGSLRIHPHWHPEVQSPEERRRLFRAEYRRWFR